MVYYAFELFTKPLPVCCKCQGY